MLFVLWCLGKLGCLLSSYYLMGIFVPIVAVFSCFLRFRLFNIFVLCLKLFVLKFSMQLYDIFTCSCLKLCGMDGLCQSFGLLNLRNVLNYWTLPILMATGREKVGGIRSSFYFFAFWIFCWFFDILNCICRWQILKPCFM